MKLTQQQLQQIQQHLRSVLKFKDTYEELYDHILSALENAPAEVTFEEVLTNIIENELGGLKGIKEIENKDKWVAIKALIKDYLNYVAHCLSSAILLIIIAATGLFYLSAKYQLFEPVPSYIIVWFMAMLPQLILIYQKIRQGKIGRLHSTELIDAKSSIKAITVGVMCFAVLFMYLIPSLIYTEIHTKLILAGVPEINWGVFPVTLLFFVGAIHSLTFYKLYKNNDKVEVNE